MWAEALISAELVGAGVRLAWLRHPTLVGGERSDVIPGGALRRGGAASNRLPGLPGLLAGGLLPRSVARA